MHEKIYRSIRENQRNNTIQTMRILNLIDDDIDEDELIFYNNKDVDLKMLLSKFKLIENSPENFRTIHEFHGKLLKCGIRIGIVQGKKLVINAIKNNSVKFEKLMKADIQSMKTIETEPIFLMELKETVFKEKFRPEGTNLKHIMDVEFGDEEHRILSELKDSQMNLLYGNLNVENERLEKIKNKIITIRPKSTEYPFNSALYKNHNGKYKFETLMHQYSESILRDGLAIGMQYGKSFIIEDLQNERFDREFIENMSPDDIDSYCREIRTDF